MTTLMASAAVLGLLTLSPALADTIVDYSFSGAVSGQGVAAGTVAVADGQLVFDQTGRNVTPASFFPIITGVPGYYAGGYIGLVAYDDWSVSPDGSLLSGSLETGSGAKGVPNFLLSRSADGISGGSFRFWLDNVTPEYFASSDVTFTQMDPQPVPEPGSLVILSAALLGLGAMRRRAHPAM